MNRIGQVTERERWVVVEPGVTYGQLSEELEKHVITCSTVVYVPKDLPHCPLNFKVIEQPIVFMAIILGHKYIKKPIPKK